MDMSQYRDLFVSEAQGHLGAFNGLMVHLEESPDDKAAIDELFRHAHSLKGMAATMGYEAIARVAHLMEDNLSRVRSGEIPMLPSLVDLLLEGGDALAAMVATVEAGSETIEQPDALIARLTGYTPDSDRRASRESPGDEVVTPVSTPPKNQHQFRHSDTFKSIRIKTETLDHLVNITGELITNRHYLTECARLSGQPEFTEPLKQLKVLLRRLKDEVFQARMLPFSFIAERFPRLVRDLARKQGKEVAFHLDGKEIELDRGILEEISEPLVHLLRNAVDHGMETPDERVAAGKPPSGEIRLCVVRDKDHVDIAVEDDGRGMDPERLKSKAVAKGIITPSQAAAMTPQESFMLVCAPGFSTAETVSDISGRGVGMDAVRSAVLSLNGVLSIQPGIHGGTRFAMRLPITVSIINALMVQSGRFEIAFPVNAVKRTIELSEADITEESGQQVAQLEGSSLPVRELGPLLGHTGMPKPREGMIPAVVCETGGSRAAFLVDRLCGHQEIFVRPLGSPLSFVRGISGATITGDGRVVFVADAASLM